MNSPPKSTDSATPSTAGNFIHEIVEEDLRAGRNGGAVVTRFPPEPNGYLHIGHAKSICLNFGTAQKYGGRCHLRFDDTNPVKEEQEYIDAIKADVRWLGFEWDPHEYYASDYFSQLYEWAVLLVKGGKAYVDDQSAEQIRLSRGTLTKPGAQSPNRHRSVEENLDLFERMRKGEFPNASRVLRAKIDMASPNVNLRDPVMYRILHAEHHRTGNAWCIYPMYDWAHGQSDWIEGITHSVCTLEFEDHRPLYDWFVEQLMALGAKPKGVEYRPRQYEFARLNVTYTMMSKRKLLELVQEGHVTGWNDPRMPTISGMRRRGYTPASLRSFAERVGVTKFNSTTELALLEHSVRGDLNKSARRAMAVLNPLRVIIDNYPDGQEDLLEAVNNPEDVAAGTRQVPFSREIYIEQDDFREAPPPKYYRLYPGNEVRLRYGYLVRCVGVDKDAAGNVTAIHCTYNPATRGGNAPDGRKVKATMHWVSARHALDAPVRLYDSLFTREDPNDVPGEADGDWRKNLNPASLTVITAKVEPSLAHAAPGEQYQFERLAYFCVDADSAPGKPVFNRTVTLKDTWARIEKKSG
ncbi:MAG: glutamine--tRNA ligase/YqeY domain fusion protein [Phycisphaeraceae bacterium]